MGARNGPSAQKIILTPIPENSPSEFNLINQWIIWWIIKVSKYLQNSYDLPRAVDCRKMDGWYSCCLQGPSAGCEDKKQNTYSEGPRWCETPSVAFFFFFFAIPRQFQWGGNLTVSCMACVAGLWSLTGDVDCVLTGSFPVNAPSEPVSLSRRVLISSCSSSSRCSPEPYGNHITKALQTRLMPTTDLRLTLRAVPLPSTTPWGDSPSLQSDARGYTSNPAVALSSQDSVGHPEM